MALLIAELHFREKQVDVRMGALPKLDQTCRLWCSGPGKAAKLVRHEPGSQPPTILAEYRHDGEKLIVNQKVS